jgi:hypothetical protein
VCILSARSAYAKSLTWRNNSGFSHKKVQRSVARSAQDQKSTKCRRNPSEEEFAEVGQDKGLRSIQEETRTVDLRRDKQI